MGVDFVALGAVVHHVLQGLQRDAHIVVPIGVAGLDGQHVVQLLNLSGGHRDEAVLVETDLAAQGAALGHGAGVGGQVAAAVQLLQDLQLGLEHDLGVVEVLVQGHFAHRVEEGVGVVVEYGVAVRLLSGDALSQAFRVAFFQGGHDSDFLSFWRPDRNLRLIL